MDAEMEETRRTFNSPLEAGIRAVVLLEELRPTAVDLADFILLDHLVVHTGDVGGPPSLHPDLPNRKGELLVRRQLIESGLELMRKSHLVEQRNLQDGFLYAASEEAASYVDLLESEYSLSLKARAAWLAKKLKSDGWEEFKLQVKASIGERTPAFVSDDTTKKPVPILRRRCIDGEGEATAHALEIAPTLERFATLAAIYDSDVKRLESLEEGGAALLAGSRRPCPLCGAEPADQRHSHGLDEVELSRKGARAEIDKILRERTDLERTVRSLRAEGLGRRAEEFAAEEKRTTPRSHL